MQPFHLHRQTALVQALGLGEGEEGARVCVESVAVHAGGDSLFLPAEGLPKACESFSRVLTAERESLAAQGSQAFARGR